MKACPVHQHGGGVPWQHQRHMQDLRALARATTHAADLRLHRGNRRACVSRRIGLGLILPLPYRPVDGGHNMVVIEQELNVIAEDLAPVLRRDAVAA